MSPRKRDQLFETDFFCLSFLLWSTDFSKPNSYMNNMEKKDQKSEQEKTIEKVQILHHIK